VRHSRPAGSKEERIELDVPEGSFVSFPSWAWNTVFCQKYLAVSAADHDAWKRRLKATGLTEDSYPLPRTMQREVEASWTRLFQLELPTTPWRRSETIRGREAVLSELRHEWVTDVTAFVGTGKWDKPVKKRSG
jgi:hypothetical protein